MALSFGFGLGVSLVPDALKGLPTVIQQVLGSPITISGVVAITLTLVLPDDRSRATEPSDEPASKAATATAN